MQNALFQVNCMNSRLVALLVQSFHRWKGQPEINCKLLAMTNTFKAITFFGVEIIERIEATI